MRNPLRQFFHFQSLISAIAITWPILGFCSFVSGQTVTNSGSRATSTSNNGPAATIPRPPASIGHPTFMSPQASPIVIHDNHVFVANTPASTVDVIDTKTRTVIRRIPVGIDPVGLGLRPDGKELWVANHISDSVNVINTDPKSPTFLQVIANIQDLDPVTRATRFDEPVGIAFASNEKAYVALSSENKIAVINVATRRIDKYLPITAQDPRAITVRGDFLYVLPFESGNKTQLSGGTGPIDGNLITFDGKKHVLDNNNVLSIGAVVDIVKHPKVPDRDLYVFNTKTDQLVKVVDTLGTLLYGLAVDSQGKVFIAQTDARNDVNGRSGTKKHGLAELENRAFLNRITCVNPTASPVEPKFFDLEPLPPKHPAPGMALATPFAIQICKDDSTLVASASGSDKLFTVDAKSGEVLGRVDVGAVPQGIALESDSQGKPASAWVLNAAANTVSLVNLADVSKPQVVVTISLEDPTHPAVKRGRIAFSKASASTTGTFSCLSCHPDGHTDQLLWVLDTPIVTGGNQIMPRSTMPCRGLRDTAPFHWDGIPGDPYGGINSANIHRKVEPNSKLEDPASSTRHLIDGGLASTMKMVGDKTVNDEGKAGGLTKADRDDMAVFLLSVPYPPAQRRSYNNVLSNEAQKGFKLFHIDGDLDPSKLTPNVCGDCHRMPYWVSTNTPGTGMEAPTWRGAYDRWLILPQGRLNLIDFDFYRAITKLGTPEKALWKFSWGGRSRFDPVWDMVLEGSTGFSGSFARQFTINKYFVDPKNTQKSLMVDLMVSLEQSAREGAIVLQGEGYFLENGIATPVRLQFDPSVQGGTYVQMDGDRKTFQQNELLTLAGEGRFVGTFTAHNGAKVDVDHPQPAIWTLGPIQEQRGRQEFPIIYPDKPTMKVSGRHIQNGARLFVNGRKVAGTIQGEKEIYQVSLESLPKEGMHLLQVQNPDGLFSNDFIFHVTENAEGASKLKRDLDQAHLDSRIGLSNAISKGNREKVKQLLDGIARVNSRHPSKGSTPLSDAALFDQTEIARYLIQRGAKVQATNEDGNTPLHVAAFLCRTEMVKLLLENGAQVTTKNKRGETPIDVVSSPWSQSLADFYEKVAKSADILFDLKQIEKDRSQIARILRERGEKNKSSEKPGTR